MTTAAQQPAPAGRGEPAPKAMRVGAATRYIGMQRSKLYQLMSDGRLPFVTIDRVRLIRTEDLDRLLDPTAKPS